jgi:hypothetical protein
MGEAPAAATTTTRDPVPATVEAPPPPNTGRHIDGSLSAWTDGRPAAGTPLTRQERWRLFTHLSMTSGTYDPQDPGAGARDAAKQIDHLLQQDPEGVRDMWKDVLSDMPRPPLQ